MPFINSFQKKVWEDKYQYKNETFHEFCSRIAYTIFSEDKIKAEQLKKSIIKFRTLFGGRINSNIGISEKGLTLFNCFIEATVRESDSLEGIMDMLTKYALTLKTEGGVGFCANFLRPANTLIRKIGVTSPGAVKFLELFDGVSDVITSGSVSKEDSFQGDPTKKSIRKGATMVTMSINHPDVEEFITAKSIPNRLTKMNMSVLITDAFMYAVDNDLDWDLWFPDINHEKYDSEWDGDFEKWAGKGYSTVVYKTVKATQLWELLLKSSYCVPGTLKIPAYVNNNFINITIEELHNNVKKGNTVEVLSVNNSLKLERKAVVGSVCNGKKEVLNITTNSNLVYTCTDEHRLFGVTEGKLLSEKLAKTFNIGDFIARTTVTNIENNKFPIDSDWEIFVGLLLGDGSVRRGNVRVATHIDQVSEILPLINKIAKRYNRKAKLVYDKRSNNWVEININSVKLSNALEKFMYKDKFVGKRTSIKIIPNYLFTTLNLDSVRNFISGYFSADGCANGQKTTFYSKHDHIAIGIQRLLLRLGIISRKYKVVHKEFGVSGFRVDIDFVNMLVLLKEIPEFLVESKIKRFIPKNKYKAPVRLMSYDEVKSCSNKSSLFKKNGVTAQNNFPEKYKNLFDGDVRYEKVVAVSKNEKVPVYDLTIADNENFICVDGGLYHNCRNEPGILFIDTIRKMDNLGYLDSSILATNPCIVAGTLVPTVNGVFPVENIVKDQEIQTTIGFGGVDKIEVHENEDVYRVTFYDGFYQDVTMGHIFHTMPNCQEARKTWVNDKRLSDIKIGEFVRKNWYEKFPNLDTSLSRDEGLLIGLYLGNGSFSNYATFNILTNGTENNKFIVDLFERLGGRCRVDDSGSDCKRYYFTHNLNYIKELFNKLIINPDNKNFSVCNLINTNRNFILGLIDGLLCSNGNINLKGRYAQVRFKNSSRLIHNLLKHLFLFVKADYKIYLSCKAGESSVIYGRKVVRKKDCFEGIIDNDSILNLYNHIRFLSHPEKNEKFKTIIKTKQLNGVKWQTRIKNIEYKGKATVYDLYEPRADDWNHEGYVSRGCGEVVGNTGVIEHKGSLYELGDVCNLGSLVLPMYYNMKTEKFDETLFKKDIILMVEALDNVIDISDYPLPMYEEAAKMKRKIGVGVAGVGSLFMMMGIRYGSDESIKILEPILSVFMNTLYQASALLAKEKGPFELYSTKLLQSGYVANNTVLTKETIDLIKKYGLRNSALSAIAPNGTLAILAGNVSGGLEPVFSTKYNRWSRVEGKKVDFEYPNIHRGEWFSNSYFKEESVADESILLSTDGKYRVDKNQGLCEEVTIYDYGYDKAVEYGKTMFTSASELSVQEHFKVLSTFAKYVDLSCSKTITLPEDTTFEDFKKVYGNIYKYGIKGCTTYREGTSVAVLESVKKNKEKSIKKQQREFIDAFKDHDNGNIMEEVVKLPEEYPSKGYIIKAQKKKWYLFVAFKDKEMTKPFAIFVNTNDPSPTYITMDAIEKMKELATTVGLGGSKLSEVERKYSNQKNSVKIARMLGFLFRHNVPMLDIIMTLDRVEDAHPGTFVFRIKKFLGQFVTGPIENLGITCPECGGKNVIFQEGCTKCLDCGGSACG